MKKNTEFPFLLIQTTQGTLPGREKSKILTKLSLTLIEPPPRPRFSQKNRPPLFTQECVRWSDGKITEKWTIPSPYFDKISVKPQKVSEKKRAAPFFSHKNVSDGTMKN